ncbi:MAG: hypothetical protein HZC37_01420 [Burkholderiales bacterium]|nr:hypothetical protein [Burkholderiales bacterium]
MPHELKNLPDLSHDMLSVILVGGLASAVAIVGLALLLGWKHRRKHPGSARDVPARPLKIKRRKRR